MFKKQRELPKEDLTPGFSNDELTAAEQREMLFLLRWMRDFIIRYNLMDAVRLSVEPRRLIRVNLLSGIARGFGYAIGFFVLVALCVYIINLLNLVSLPIIGDFISKLLEYIEVKV